MKKFKYLVCCILSFFLDTVFYLGFLSQFLVILSMTKAIDTKTFSRLFTVYRVIVVPFAIFALIQLLTVQTE